MSLSCDYYYEPEPGDVCWRCPSKWRAYDFKRARKCCSCGEKIKKGDAGKDYIEFERYKVPEYDIELRIYGEDYDQGPPRASRFMCFECGWRYHVLAKAGYAVSLHEDMRALFIEHEEMTARGQGGCL